MFGLVALTLAALAGIFLFGIFAGLIVAVGMLFGSYNYIIGVVVSVVLFILYGLGEIWLIAHAISAWIAFVHS